jgi:hypothetical protein
MTPDGTGSPRGQFPADPLSTLAQGAVAMHELFSAYTAAGFSQEQALTLLIGTVVQHIRQGGGHHH